MKVVAAAGGEEGVTAKSVDKAQLLSSLKDAIEMVSQKMQKGIMQKSAASSARDATNAMRKNAHHFQTKPLVVAKCATSPQHSMSYGHGS
jgi:hypothetical protein